MQTAWQHRHTTAPRTGKHAAPTNACNATCAHAAETPREASGLITPDTPAPGASPHVVPAPDALAGVAHDATQTPALVGPTCNTLPHGDIAALLEKHEALDLITVRLEDHLLLRQLYGDELTASIHALLRDCLAAQASLHDTDSTSHTLVALGAGEYLLLLPATGSHAQPLADTAFTLRITVQHCLSETVLRWTGREVQLGVGCASYHRQKGSPPQHTFLQALCHARMMSRREMDLSSLRLAREFATLVESGSIHMLYQPIVHFPTGRIMAWEALARGPADTPFHSPLVLFDMAEELGMLFTLERACREAAIASAGTLDHEQKLFLNIHPRTLSDPHFTPGKTLEALQRMGLRPENVVFEITERHAIRDFSMFHKTLAHYRGQGFRIAIDDAGTGYSGLAAIAELKPDFIKVDMSLIRNIHRDPVRTALMETLVSFAEKIGAEVIAEGIETREEATKLMAIGAHYGQGYFLGRPSHPKTELHMDLSDLQPPAVSHFASGMACSLPVGDLAETAHTIAPTTLVEDVRHLLDKENQSSSLAVVDEAGRPLGLVMDYHLNRQLSAQYGVALYFKRPVTALMDREPIILDAAAPVEEAARIAMARSRLRAYDDILVTRGGILSGMVPVQRLLHTIAKVQVELAKGTNPLSGLPGNVALEKELEGRLAGGQPFSLIYADLDNFKSYNDTYGFKNGDRIILLLARILGWARQRHGLPSDFVAHIGGDDFVCIASPARAERICKAVIRCFGRLVRDYYCGEDRTRGWITARGRDGVERQFPFVSVSLAVVDCRERSNLLDIGERAAHVKHLAKSIPGNNYVMECGVCRLRRTGGEAAAPRRRLTDQP